MAVGRKATPVKLTDPQRERLEHLWFVYGNHGPKTTPGNHQFIQGLLEHGLDLRPLQTRRTAKRDIPTEECVAAVEAVLTRAEDGDDAPRRWFLRLAPSHGNGRGPEDPNRELKALLREARERVEALREADAPNSGGDDAA